MNDSKSLKPIFQINPDITFLNHGSYGACPRPVFENYQDWQHKIEQNPVQFMANDVYNDLEISRSTLGKYLNCHMNDIVYFPNPTHAVASIIDNIRINENEEVLSTDLEYGSCDRMWFYHSKKNKYNYNRVKINFPIIDKASFLENFWEGASDKTKYIFISHITSGTGMILPVQDIINEAKKRNIKTIIDGAHVPGQLPLDLNNLDADFYVGACHKWLCSPKGSSFLYVKRELQHDMEPYLKSWGWGEDYPEFVNSTQKKSPSRFQNIFQWQGTRDMSAFLAVPSAIKFHNDYNWLDVIARCKEMVIHARNTISDFTGLPKICPDNFLEQMATILIPHNNHIELKNTLYNDYNIEIPTYSKDNHVAIRISVQGYNDLEDINRLTTALKAII